MRRALVIAAALCAPCLVPASSRAFDHPVSIDGPSAAQRAVDRMHTPVPDNQSVQIAGCPGWPTLAACNFPTADSPIYIHPDDYSSEALYREIGGRFGTLAMDAGARNRFATLMRSHGQWDNGDIANDALDQLGLSEKFEDAYADCAFGYVPQPPRVDRVERWIDEFGYRPSRRQHRLICALINKAGARAGFVTPSP